MFTSRPLGRDGTNGNGSRNGNGHKNSNGNRNGHVGWHLPSLGKSESVLGPGIYYRGTLTGSGNVRLEGTFDGEINIKGTVTIANGGKVTANIKAGTAIVAGSLKGNITAEKVDIRATGRVWGDVLATAFATEEGAFLRGAIQMEDRLTPLLELAEADTVRPAEEETVG